MASDRDIDRVRKLLALAAATSGGTVPERENAALEAVRLMHVHDLDVCPRPPPPVRVPRQRAAYQPVPAPVRIQGMWGASGATARANGHEQCAVCGYLFKRGELLWAGDQWWLHLSWPEWPCRGDS